ncbi:transport protein sec16a [Plakobranchus ocellatus]|uniref:Transport protein sec16a n=1 Tax=Plakobranchus ocellatus TaxID=259542 RepID=A0AAV4DY81_9GAST|nr:transport protein sec16a [Plakobranchus ocellatus]
MDEGRLRAVRKSQRLHRKFAHAINDTIRNRQEYYQSCLSREEQEARARLVSKVIGMRRTVVRNRVLLQCLNVHRKNHPDRAHTEPLLGKYGGRPIDSFTRDIDQKLAWYHPRLRRLRKVDRIKQSCLKHGDILSEDTIREKMSEFFTNNLDLLSPRHHDGTDSSHQNGDNNDRNDHNDDDDDFNIRNFPNPLGAANIRLRLHPFGNMVDFNTTKSSNSLQARRNIINKSTVKQNKTAGETDNVGYRYRSLPAPSALKKQSKDNGTKTETPTHTAKLETSSSPSREDQSPRLSKYAKPLPPIVSKDVEVNSPGTSISGTISDVEKGKGQGKEHEDKGATLANSIPKTLRLTHERQRNGNAKNDSLTKAVVDNLENSPSQTESERAKEDRPPLTRRKTLILPPIETSKDMLKSN